LEFEILKRAPDDADFVKGGYHYSRKDILEELQKRAEEEYAMGSTLQEVCDFWKMLLEDYDLVTTIHKARAKDLIKKTFEP